MLQRFESDFEKSEHPIDITPPIWTSVPTFLIGGRRTMATVPTIKAYNQIYA